MVDESEIKFKGYKIFCFNGVPKIVQVDFDHFTNHKRNLYDVEWNYLPVSIHYSTVQNNIVNKPENLGKMLNLAKILFKNIPHVRVEFYSIHNKNNFGELTFTHGAGYENFEPKEFSLQMESCLELPKVKI